MVRLVVFVVTAPCARAVKVFVSFTSALPPVTAPVVLRLTKLAVSASTVADVSFKTDWSFIVANAPVTVPLAAVNTAALIAVVSEFGKVTDVAATDMLLSVLALNAFAWIRLPETVAVEPVPSVVAVKPVEAFVAAVTALSASLSCCDAIAMPTPTVVPERPIALVAVLPVTAAKPSGALILISVTTSKKCFGFDNSTRITP